MPYNFENLAALLRRARRNPEYVVKTLIAVLSIILSVSLAMPVKATPTITKKQIEELYMLSDRGYVTEAQLEHFLGKNRPKPPMKPSFSRTIKRLCTAPEVGESDLKDQYPELFRIPSTCKKGEEVQIDFFRRSDLDNANKCCLTVYHMALEVEQLGYQSIDLLLMSDLFKQNQDLVNNYGIIGKGVDRDGDKWIDSFLKAIWFSQVSRLVFETVPANECTADHWLIATIRTQPL